MSGLLVITNKLMFPKNRPLKENFTIQIDWPQKYNSCINLKDFFNIFPKKGH